MHGMKYLLRVLSYLPPRRMRIVAVAVARTDLSVKVVDDVLGLLAYSRLTTGYLCLRFGQVDFRHL